MLDCRRDALREGVAAITPVVVIVAARGFESHSAKGVSLDEARVVVVVVNTVVKADAARMSAFACRDRGDADIVKRKDADRCLTNLPANMGVHREAPRTETQCSLRRTTPVTSSLPIQRGGGRAVEPTMNDPRSTRPAAVLRRKTA